MPILWRLYRAKHGPGLDGIGGLFAEGRWHSRGERVVYFGSSAAMVVLERLVHTDADLLPNDLRLGCFEFSQAVSELKVEALVTMPVDWSGDENLTRRTGGLWRSKHSTCVLVVPSAILPEETNFVFNPLHAEAKHLQLICERPFQFDARLV